MRQHFVPTTLWWQWDECTVTDHGNHWVVHTARHQKLNFENIVAISYISAMQWSSMLKLFSQCYLHEQYGTCKHKITINVLFIQEQRQVSNYSCQNTSRVIKYFGYLLQWASSMPTCYEPTIRPFQQPKQSRTLLQSWRIAGPNMAQSLPQHCSDNSEA